MFFMVRFVMTAPCDGSIAVAYWNLMRLHGRDHTQAAWLGAGGRRATTIPRAVVPYPLGLEADTPERIELGIQWQIRSLPAQRAASVHPSDALRAE